jgi:squalene synthase HpnC
VSHGNGTHAAAVSARATGDAAVPALPAVPALQALSERAAGENFPVALRILPRTHRRHLMAVYRFARFVDDIGDEGGGADEPGDRLRALDAVERDLDLAFSGAFSGARSGQTSGQQVPAIPVIRELARTAAECAIPAEPFRMLIQANRQDQVVSRYETFDDLLGYCQLSANPVGRVVLRVFGAATPERERLSDLVCTALQLAEHWQDVAEDFGRDRIYLPREDMEAFGCTERDLISESGAAPRLRKLMRFETERAARLLDEGAALTGTLRGWARLAVAGYVAGGRATLAAIAAAGTGSGPAGFDVLATTPRPATARTAVELLRAYLTGR